MGLVTGLALGATAIGAGLSAASQNKSSKRAAQTSADNNAANVALARESRDMSLARLDPYNFRGNLAGNQINALLGLGGGMQLQGGPMNVGALPGYGAPNALSQFQPTQSAASRYGLGDSPGFEYSGFGGGVVGNAMNAVNNQNGAVPQGGVMPTATTGVPQAATQTPQQAAENAFDIFRNSTGYQFTRDEGLDAVTSAYSGIGAFQSGAAMRGISDYGQNQALNNAFIPYLNALGAQQAVGAGAASAGAGVTQNFAGTVIDSNNFNAQNQMAAQLGRQNVFGNALGTIGGLGLGFLGGR